MSFFRRKKNGKKNTTTLRGPTTQWARPAQVPPPPSYTEPPPPSYWGPSPPPYSEPTQDASSAGTGLPGWESADSAPVRTHNADDTQTTQWARPAQVPPPPSYTEQPPPQPPPGYVDWVPSPPPYTEPTQDASSAGTGLPAKRDLQESAQGVDDVLRSLWLGSEPVGSSASPAGRTSSPGGGDADSLLRLQVASFEQLENLTRENRYALDGIRRIVGKPSAGSSSEFADAEKLRELDRLVAVAKDLDEITMRHKEDKDIQAKELALPLDSKAYSGVVRAGLCNAYLAASVVDSSLVSTSKTGGMGKAGEALKVLSSAVPVVGGLASFAAAAVKAGDHRIQTRRVVKITEMATDVTECCSVARMLALGLADGHAAGTIPTARRPTRGAGVVDRAGECGWDQGGGAGALPEGADEEAVMEWFVDGVANGGDANNSNGTSDEKAGRRLGKRHLQKLLKAVGRGCLRGTNTAEQKVERLLKVIIPEASGTTATIPRAPEQAFVRSPVSAPPDDGGLDRDAEFAAMRARLEALEADNKRLEALEAENKRLAGEVNAVKKRIPESKRGQSGAVDLGGGQMLAQKQETKTKEDFWQEAETPVAAADHVVTFAQFSEFVALQDERHRGHEDRHRDHEANHDRLQRALDRKKNVRGGRR